VTSQKRVPFGDAIVEALDTVIAAESCEELYGCDDESYASIYLTITCRFTPDAPHILQSLNGVEIFTNSSGTHLPGE